MRRAELFKKLNRNNNVIFNYGNRTSICDDMGPNVIVDHMWLNDDEITTGVQITELKTSRSQSPEIKDYCFSRAGSHVNRSQLQDNEKHEANERRNDARRMAYQTNDFHMNNENEYDNDIFSGYYASPDNDNNDERENVVLNHQTNCFTILDRRNKVNSDSSSDEYRNVEEINFNETMPEYSWDSNEKSFDEDPDALNTKPDSEKRTIWIYSFKNKRLISEDDFQLVNIPSKDNSASSSIEDIDAPRERTRSRVATPIPKIYVPKLNISLTPNLPTVTEITEPNRHFTSNQTEKSYSILTENSGTEATLKQKSINNWCVNEPATSFVNQNSKSTNVIDWMALSPRQKRRIFKNINSQSQTHLPTVREVSRYAEEKMQIAEESYGNDTRRTIGSQTHPVVEVETHSARNFRTPKSAKLDLAMNKVVEEPDIEESTPEDRGDHVKNKYFRKLQIRCKPKRVTGKQITDPIERLDGNWIAEDDIKRKGSKDCKTDETHGDCAGNTLLIRNISLLKPALWTEYLPITESIPSLHLSINTDSEQASQKWYRRLAKYFMCCK